MISNKLSFLIIVLLVVPAISFAWDDCPYGLLDDPYPGECGLYIDTNDDGLCDHSQSESEVAMADINKESTEIKRIVAGTEEVHDIITGQELKTKTVREVAELYGIDKDEYSAALSDYYNTEIHCVDSFQVLHDDFSVAPSVAKEIAEGLMTGEETVAIPAAETAEKHNSLYHLVPITVTIVLLYVISLLLMEKGVITVVHHKQIWNMLLMLSFLVSGILGILLVVRINYGTVFHLPFNMLYWHVETGIVMVEASFIHVFEHRHFFLNMLKRVRKG